MSYFTDLPPFFTKCALIHCLRSLDLLCHFACNSVFRRAIQFLYFLGRDRLPNDTPRGSINKSGQQTVVCWPHQALFHMYRERDSNPHEQIAQRILSPLRLPIPPSRQAIDLGRKRGAKLPHLSERNNVNFHLLSDLIPNSRSFVHWRDIYLLFSWIISKIPSSRCVITQNA